MALRLHLDKWRRLEVEAGMGNDAAGVCWSASQAVDIYRVTYEERWGPVDLAGWVVRLRRRPLRNWAQGETWPDVKVMDIAGYGLRVLPHELHHVQLGPGQRRACGLVLWYYPWERDVLGFDVAAYLGCAAGA